MSNYGNHIHALMDLYVYDRAARVSITQNTPSKIRSFTDRLIMSRNRSNITPFASLKSLLSFKTAVFGIPVNGHLEWEKESDKKQKKNRDTDDVIKPIRIPNWWKTNFTSPLNLLTRPNDGENNALLLVIKKNKWKTNRSHTGKC